MVLLEILMCARDSCLPPSLPLTYCIYSLAFASSVGAVDSGIHFGMHRTMSDASEALSESRPVKEMTALKQPWCNVSRCV